MGSLSWSQVLANLGLAAIIVIAWVQVLERFPWIADRGRSWILGVVLATGAILSMSVPLIEIGGFRADLRSSMILLAGYFGGTVAAAVASVPVIAYRIYLGGAGAWIGIVLVLIYAAVGVAASRLLGRRTTDLAILAITAASLNQLLSYLLLPTQIFDNVVATSVIPLSLATIANVFLIGFALQDYEFRRRLDRTNARYRAMVDALPECLNLKDAEGRFLIANPATVAQLGATDDGAVIGRSDADFHPPDIAAGFASDEAQVIAARRALTFEQPFTRPDGSDGWLSTIKAPMIERGRVAGIITHNRDITEQRRLQSELGTARRLLSDALENMGEGLVVLDRDGVIVLCNERYRELFPLTAHLRIPGARLDDILRSSTLLGEEEWTAPGPPGGKVDSSHALLTAKQDRKIRLADGRTLRAQTRPVADGGRLILLTDITERERFEAELHYRATHDPLTGLANRANLEGVILRAQDLVRPGGPVVAVMLIDLDHFKEINDLHGHLAGDHLLVSVARRIEAELGPDDVCARLGGDEFAVIARCGPTADTPAGLAARIVAAIRRPLTYRGVDVTPGTSLGYVVLTGEPTSVEELLRRADRALYAAKTEGRGRAAAYDPAMDAAESPGKSASQRRWRSREPEAGGASAP